MQADYNGSTIVIPESGGKAGKGRNITGSVQVRRFNSIVKQFRFKTDAGAAQAIEKAKRFIDANAR
jgi:hypothetical protein